MTNRIVPLAVLALSGCTLVPSPYYNLDTGEQVHLTDDLESPRVVCGIPGTKKAAGFSLYDCEGSTHWEVPFGETLAVGSSTFVRVHSPSKPILRVGTSDGSILTTQLIGQLNTTSWMVKVTAVSAGMALLIVNGADGMTIDSADVPIAEPAHVSSGLAKSMALLDWVTVPVCAGATATDGTPLIGDIVATGEGDVSVGADFDCGSSLFQHPFMIKLPRDGSSGTATFSMGAASTSTELRRVTYADITRMQLWRPFALGYQTPMVGVAFFAGDTEVYGAECDSSAMGVSIVQREEEGNDLIYTVAPTGVKGTIQTLTCSIDGGRIEKSIRIATD